MPATIYDVTVEQGATFKRKIVITDDEEKPRDFTDWKFRGQIRKSYDAAQALANFSFDVSNQEDNPGEFVFKLTPTQTAAIPADPSEGYERNITRLIYDVEAESPDGTDVDRLLEGTVLLSPEVTRDDSDE